MTKVLGPIPRGSWVDRSGNLTPEAWRWLRSLQGVVGGEGATQTDSVLTVSTISPVAVPADPPPAAPVSTCADDGGVPPVSV